MWETWLTVVVVAVVLIVGAGAGALLWLRGRSDQVLPGRSRPARDQFRRGAEPAPRRRVTIILNPTKVDDPSAVGAALTRQALELGWAAPEILLTTVEDPGYGQARAALESGTDLVCALGGDGTVRAVAEVLTGTLTPMGLLARGTGNLLARNLQLPLDSIEPAMLVALTGLNRHIDVGWVTIDPTPEQLAEQPVVGADEDEQLRVEAASVVRADPADQEYAGAVGVRPAGEAGAGRPAGVRGHEAGAGRPAGVRGHEAGAGRPAGAGGHEVDAGRPAGVRGHEAGRDHPDETDGRAAQRERAESERAGGRSAPPANEHAFLVMGGLGFDAAIMEGTSEELKARVGWPAYIAGGAKSLLRARFRTTLVVDGGEETTRRARTVVVGNCGRLTGGINLMPDAEVDDGILDVVAITPRGIAAWAGVAAHVLTQRQKEHSQLDRYRCRRAVVTVEEPQRVQVDGEVLGEARQVLFSIRPSSLIVRVAALPTREPGQPSP